MSVTVRQASLEQLETVIERGIQTFVEVGLALMEVRDRKLYEEAGYTTFEMYCYGRWGFKRRQGYRLIEAAQTVKMLNDGDDVSHGTQNPDTARINERQARELASLAKSNPEQARAVWREVNKEAEREERPVTAKAVKQAVQRVTRVREPDYVDAEYVERDPDPRIWDLKAAIQLLEPLYRDYDDVLAPMIRANVAGLRNVLYRMQEETDGL